MSGEPLDDEIVKPGTARALERIQAQRNNFFKQHKQEHPTKKPNCGYCEDMEYYDYE